MLQIIVNSIISGLVLSLVAVGFNLIFNVTKVFHIAQGAIYIIGAYSYLLLFGKFQNEIISIVGSFLIVSVLIFVIEKSIYLPFNKTQSNQILSFIASMSLYVILINLIALFFGNENKTMDLNFSNPININEILLTKVQIIQLLVSLIILAVLIIYFFISNSKLVFQSISDNEIISKTFGINIHTARMKVFLISSVLVCTAAILKLIDTGIDPRAGMSITLTAAVVSILVGRFNIKWLVAISILLTLIQNYLEWFLNSQWRDGITFLILLIVILYRTEGILSYNLRKDTL